jgi:hypothetical protein
LDNPEKSKWQLIIGQFNQQLFLKRIMNFWKSLVNKKEKSEEQVSEYKTKTPQGIFDKQTVVLQWETHL